MSFLSLIDEQKLGSVIGLLEKYEIRLEEGDLLFDLKGRRLEEIALTLPKHQAKYDQYYEEMKGLEDWLVNMRERLYAKYWKKYVEGYPRQLAATDIKAYVNGEKEIIEMNQIIIEVALVKNKFKSLVEGFEQMGWMIGNTTKLRIAELEQVTL